MSCVRSRMCVFLVLSRLDSGFHYPLATCFSIIMLCPHTICRVNGTIGLISSICANIELRLPVLCFYLLSLYCLSRLFLRWAVQACLHVRFSSVLLMDHHRLALAFPYFYHHIIIINHTINQVCSIRSAAVAMASAAQWFPHPPFLLLCVFVWGSCLHDSLPEHTTRIALFLLCSLRILPLVHSTFLAHVFDFASPVVSASLH